MKTSYPWRLVWGFALLKLFVHAASAQMLGFQRDELLYRALGRHVDWGFWSNPPFIGIMGCLAAALPGPDLWATRLLPALAGAGLMGMTLDAVWRLGGKTWAIVVCGTGMLLSIAWLRAFSMLQPVPFDIFFWNLALYAWLRYLWSRNGRWWWLVGLAMGVGLMNKYTLVFLGWGMLVAMVLTAERKQLLRSGPWEAAGIALGCVAPNLLWQWEHRFPAWTHLHELAETQLHHVEPLAYLTDQLLMHGPGVLLWLLGLVGLLLAPKLRRYRPIGWFYIVVLLTFLGLSGKSYYTLGAYPVLFAAGAVSWEKLLKPVWARSLFWVLLVAASLPLIPVGLPVMKPEPLADYFRRLGIAGAVRWEDGQLHELPQDYADMLGWPELAAIVDSAIVQAGDRKSLMIYAENYGQAGAVEQFCQAIDPPPVVSFSDSYRLWVPADLPTGIHSMIYINDELGDDVKALFAETRLIDSLQVPMARERGIRVYLCRLPQKDLRQFWRARVGPIKSELIR